MEKYYNKAEIPVSELIEFLNKKDDNSILFSVSRGTGKPAAITANICLVKEGDKVSVKIQAGIEIEI
ncbi:MAG: hypothetical protein WC678_00380 [Parcubacteria group bacterium]|jgi:hypothetical protein